MLLISAYLLLIIISFLSNDTILIKSVIKCVLNKSFCFIVMLYPYLLDVPALYLFTVFSASQRYGLQRKGRVFVRWRKDL